jgi:hypothetical protein
MRNSASAVLAMAAVGALGVGLLFSLGGCVQQPRAILPTSSPSVAPVFKSDADALAAAKKTYDGYLLASDAIAHDGGGGLDRLSGWETHKQFLSDQKSFAVIEEAHEHIEGNSAYSHLTVQQIEQSANGLVSVDAYVCLDVSKTRLLAETGQDVTPVGADVIPLQVTFSNQTAGSSSLFLDGSDAWAGTDFC